MNRRKILPLAIGGLAVVGVGLTWWVAAPASQVRSGPPQVGQPAPDFTLERSDGKPWRLADQRGKEVLLVFFRTHT
jgi:cytochrome oxidase Cu insertion factor (SCO1/SenC/PrrC family)